MKKINKHVEIVRNGSIAQSSMSQESSKKIQATLHRRYERVGITTLNNLHDLEILVESQPDLVFLGTTRLLLTDDLDQTTEVLWLSDYFEAHDITYTGSPQKAAELELNKPLAKQQVLEAGLNTSAFFTAVIGEHMYVYDLPLAFPLFIKPTDKGGGQGIDDKSVVTNFSDFQSKVLSINDECQSESLVEQYLPGREFSVAIMHDSFNGDLTVMPIELVAGANASGQRIMGQEAKTANNEQVLAVTDLIIKDQIMELAAAAFRALGARDYGRIDIRLDEDGTPQFLEANLIPSLIDGYGNFPKACVLNMGMDYETMLFTITELALGRSEDPVLPLAEPVLAY